MISSSIVVVVNIVITLLIVLLSVGFFTLFERNILASCQIRIGPNKVGLIGIIQPFADAAKLVTNSSVESGNNMWQSVLFIWSPVVFIAMSCIVWVAYPSLWVIVDCQTIVLCVLVVVALSVYGVVTIGWLSSCNYAVVGALRAVSQSISYEIVLILAFFSVIWVSCSSSFLVMWSLAAISPMVLAIMVSSACSFISLLAESGRTPFDLAEGESELVSGWNVELGGQNFTLAFLAEQLSVVWVSVVLTSMFLSSSYIVLKVLMILSILVVARASYPRIRFDSVIQHCWTELLPVLVASVIIVVT